MKKSIVTIDLDDIFRVMTRTADSAFSAINISVDSSNEFCIANLCINLFDALQAQLFQISESGNMLIRIVSPESHAITLEEIDLILGSIRRFCSGDFIWGVETDDEIDKINVDLIFAINV